MNITISFYDLSIITKCGMKFIDKS